MSDEIDLAQEISERRDAVAARRRHHQPAGESLTHCSQCDEQIPEARRAASRGCTRCLKCQESFELLTYWRN